MIVRALLTSLLLVGASLAGDPPQLSYLEFETLPHWGRLSIHGSHLSQQGQVHVGGVEALVMPIQGTNAVEMNAYVPDTVPFGTWDVVVTTADGQSNALPVTIEPRVPEGRVLWRFTMNSQTMLHRPALAADGTLYAKSAVGDLIALSPAGELRWVYELGGSWTSTIDIGPDGTVYTADGWPVIHAVNPDGTQKWTYQAPLTNGLLSGPNVGPDGNVYAVAHAPGLGVYSLDPQGGLRWSSAEPGYSPIGHQGQELVFGAEQFAFCHNGHFDSYDFDGDKVFDQSTVTAYQDSSPQPAVGPSGDLYVETWGRLQSFDPSGSLNWIAFDVGGTDLSDPDVGPDGTIYVRRNVFNTLWALHPDGSERWSTSHPKSLLDPVVDPAGERLIVGVGKAGTNSGFVCLDATDGHLLWEVDLPIEQPTPFGQVSVHPQGRARFTPDGAVAYVMASGEAGSPGYSYVYALQVGPVAELGHGLGGTQGTPRLRAVGTLEGGSPLEVSVSDARPGASLHLVVGAQAVGVPFKQGVLLPRPDLVLGFSTDAAGALQFTSTWPAGLPSELGLYAQAWIQDPSGPAGWCATNGLSLITP